jgi:penicillin amidase
MRILIDLADIENSLSVLPTGQSGHLMSPHYQDQAGLYNSGKFRPQHMDKDKIIAQSKGVLFLKAGK